MSFVKSIESDQNDEIIFTRVFQFYDIERTINLEDPVWLITWCPDPKLLPSTDFYLQHNVNVKTLTTFLAGCTTGCFCVEATQLGNPHYHGWYQQSEDPFKENIRIASMKTMDHFGRLDLKVCRYPKIDKWYSTRNGLYYYKKDAIDKQLLMNPNPIIVTTESTVNFDILPLVNFINGKKVGTYADNLRDLKFRTEFYTDTIKTMNS